MANPAKPSQDTTEKTPQLHACHLGFEVVASRSHEEGWPCPAAELPAAMWLLSWLCWVLLLLLEDTHVSASSGLYCLHHNLV